MEGHPLPRSSARRPVLPILHLNEFKIAGPTVLGRAPEADVLALLRGHGYAPVVVAGDDPRRVHRDFATALDSAHAQIRAIQDAARAGTAHEAGTPAWPAIVLRTPQGWTGPHEVAGTPVEGTFRSHQVPLAGVRENPEHLAQLQRWMRSYRPEACFDPRGSLVPELAALAPDGDLRMGALPHANGRVLVALDLPEPTAYAREVTRPAATRAESTRALGELLRDICSRNAAAANFRLFDLMALQGTTTTPLDMVVLNECSRYHLVLNALRRARRLAPGARALEHHCEAQLLRHQDYIRQHFEDMPEVRDWTWPESVA